MPKSHLEHLGQGVTPWKELELLLQVCVIKEDVPPSGEEVRAPPRGAESCWRSTE